MDKSGLHMWDSWSGLGALSRGWGGRFLPFSSHWCEWTSLPSLSGSLCTTEKPLAFCPLTSCSEWPIPATKADYSQWQGPPAPHLLFSQTCPRTGLPNQPWPLSCTVWLFQPGLRHQTEMVTQGKPKSLSFHSQIYTGKRTDLTGFLGGLSVIMSVKIPSTG